MREQEEEGEIGGKGKEGRKRCKDRKRKKNAASKRRIQSGFPVSALISYQLDCIAFQGRNMKQCSSGYSRGGMSWTLHRVYSRELVVFQV